MAVVDVVQRIVLGLVAVPVAFVLLDVALDLAGAVPTNPVVSALDDLAAAVTPQPLTTMFPGQGPVLTALLVCVMYGIVAAVLIGVFRLVRLALAASRRSPPPPPP